MKQYPDWFLARLRAVEGKRPKTVIEHILEHGHITTEELQNLYGYEHPPRAARDVRELGVPLETFRTKNAQGRTIAAYRFGDLSRARKLGGRHAFAREFKRALVEAANSRCSICFARYEDRYLQVDHRVPYEVLGEPEEPANQPDAYMLLCASCNRAKSWSCEHCVNWLEEKSPAICQACYWAFPDSYKHIALRNVGRVDVVWSDKEVETYDRLRQRAATLDVPFPEYVKRVLRKSLAKQGAGGG